MSERAGAEAGGDSSLLQLGALPYVPAELLAGAGARSQLERLRRGEKVTITSVEGAALFVDVTGFSSLARSLTRSDAASAAEQLTSTLNEYFLQLVSRLHARDAEILLFAGDAVVAFVPATAARPLREAAALAVEAALDVQALAFSRSRHRLTAHTGVGAGELHLYVLQGSARAAQALYAGDLIVQVCEAQRASSEGEVVLSAPLHAMLGGSHPAEPLAAGPFFRLLPQPERPSPPPAAGELCACGAPRRAGERGAAAALEPYAQEIRQLLPAAAASQYESALWGSDIRTVFTVFASFPELDAGDPREPAPADAHLAARHAARFGQVVRSVHSVAEELGGSVNKIMLDDKGASAIVGFGLPGGFAHEDDAERAVRAALALQSWFEESGSPFACGIAAGRTFCGTLGAPCRKEYALIGDSVILAARLMGAARATIVPAGGGGTPRSTRRQAVLCDESVVAAVAAHGRATAYAFDFARMPAVRAKGFAEAVPVWRPQARAEGRPPLASPPATPPGRRLAHAAALVGREAELERALAAVDAFAAPGAARGSTLVLEGEAGMGKTRLLRELSRACEARGALVLACTAAAVEESTPLWALRGLLASAADVSSGEALQADLEARGLLPAADAALLWAHIFGGGERGAGPDPADTARSELRSYRRARGRSVADFGVALVARVASILSRLLLALESASARRPVALLVEDCHWMDSASWFVLRCLRDTCPRLLLVLTARPMADPPRDFLVLSGRAELEPATSSAASARGDAPEADAATGHEADHDSLRTVVLPSPGAADTARDDPVKPPPGLPPLALELALGPPTAGARGHGRQLPPLRAPTRVLRLSLGPLPPPAARALLAALSEQMGVEWLPDALDSVLDKAAGVPLFLVELCRQRAAFSSGRASSSAAEPFTVPETVQQIVLAQVDRVPGPAQAVLKLLAVLGSRFTPSLVAAVDPFEFGMRPAAVHRAFRQLRTAGLIAASDEAGSASRSAGSGGDEDKEAEDEGGPGGDGPGWPPPDAPFSFLHALVQEAVYGSIPEAHRREVHGRLAARLEARGADVDPALVALHWKGAGEPERALAHLERAARAAYRTNALPEARRALAELAATVEGLELAGPPLGLRLLQSVPRARSWARPGSRVDVTPEARAHWRVVRTFALHMWTNVEYYSGNLDAAGPVAEACVESVQPGWLPRKALGPLSILASLARVVRMVRRADRPAPRAPGALWLQRPEHAAERAALVDGLITCANVGAHKGSFGGRGGNGWALACILRAYEISEGTHDEMRGVSDVRAWANFATFADVVGFPERARALTDRALRLADILDSDLARAVVHNHRGIQLGRAGRFPESALEFGLASGVASPPPNNHEFLAARCIPLLLTGAFAEARRTVAEAEVFASRLGPDSFGGLLARLAGVLLALLTGRDASAEAQLARAEEALRHVKYSSRWWIESLARCGRLVLLWRRRELPAAFALAARLAATWRRETARAPSAAPILAVLFDFAMWARAEARAARPAGGRTGGIPCCKRPPSRPSKVHPSDFEPEAAEHLAVDLLRLAEGARRIPFCAPFCALAFAEDAPALRAAADGLAARGLRPFEAIARLRLARLTGDPAAAAAAARIAAETGLAIPAMGRPPGPPGAFVPLWA